MTIFSGKLNASYDPWTDLNSSGISRALEPAVTYGGGGDNAAATPYSQIPKDSSLVNYAKGFSGIQGLKVANRNPDGTYRLSRDIGGNQYQLANARVGSDGSVSIVGDWSAPMSHRSPSGLERVLNTVPLAMVGLGGGAVLGAAAGLGGLAGGGTAAPAAASGAVDPVAAAAAGLGAEGLGVAPAASLLPAGVGAAAPAGVAGALPAAAGAALPGAAAGGTGGAGWLASLGLNGGDLLRGGLGLVDSIVGMQASRRAADAGVDAANQSNALLRDIWQQTRADSAPALQARNAGLAGYQNLLAHPESVTSDPGYAFGLNQGRKALEGSAAARGGLYSGATMKALNDWGTDYATSKYDNALGRYGTLAGLGQPGANTTAQAGAVYGSQAGDNLTTAGALRGAGIVGGYNALSGGLNNFLRGWQERDLLRSLGRG